MSDHGPLFDDFAREAGSPHGGATFDTGFGLQAHVDTRGKLFDLFGKPAAPELHGEHYDDWNDMPSNALHGQTFDSDFDMPTALATSHATWFDAFRGGKVVRYVRDGAEYEGTIIDLNADYATVQTGGGADGGGRDEIFLGQILKWRDAPGANLGPDDKPTADTTDLTPVVGPGNTDTSVVGGPQGERPSGESSAMGGGERTSVDPGWESPVIALKRALGEDVDVAKDMDSHETAVEREDHDGDGGDRGPGTAYCPKCEHTCRKPQDGKCPTCGGKVTVKKTADELADVAKQLRGMVAA